MSIDINSYKTGKFSGGYAKRSAHGLWLSLLDDATIEKMLPAEALAKSKTDPSNGSNNYVFINGQPVGSGSELLVAIYFKPHPKRAAKDVGWVANYITFTARVLNAEDRALMASHMMAAVAALDTATDGKGTETFMNMLKGVKLPESSKVVYDGRFGSGKWNL